MSKTFDQYPGKTRVLYLGRCVSSIYAASQWNPPSSYRKMWRRQTRARQNQMLQRCKDFEELQIETKLSRLTSIYDWY